MLFINFYVTFLDASPNLQMSDEQSLQESALSPHPQKGSLVFDLNKDSSKLHRYFVIKSIYEYFYKLVSVLSSK